ncbi:hypothetical protein GGR28_001760 [Lewinella aquimaris]|uniref:Uncharacterized protein n=1 Tax=Neolewinella aquimaris TaxID=1835722 RepID=A0A840E5B3_9BACT|nr:hypothetical protein [Neolewinella aquimaris]
MEKMVGSSSAEYLLSRRTSLVPRSADDTGTSPAKYSKKIRVNLCPSAANQRLPQAICVEKL